MSVQRPDLKAVLAYIDKLPQPPKACMQALSLLDNPDVSIAKSAQFIGMDECLTAKLLKMANSAHYGYSSKVHTVTEAITRVGVNTTKSSLYGYLLEQQGYKITPLFLELWQSALYTAMLSVETGSKLGLKRPDLCFTTALLCNVGQLVLYEFSPVFYKNLVDEAKKRNMQMSDIEQQVLGFNHTRVGNEVANTWKLPPLHKQVIKYHHDPLRAKASALREDYIHIVAVYAASCMSPWPTEGSSEALDADIIKSARESIALDNLVWGMQQRHDTIVKEVTALTSIMFGLQTTAV